jgi:hypothetical protein
MPRGIEAKSLVIGTQSVVFTRGGDMALSIGQMVGSTVVLGMSVLPGKIRNELRLVDDKTDYIIQKLTVRKGPMAAFVSEDPVSGEYRPHPKSIHIPTDKPLERLNAQ